MSRQMALPRGKCILTEKPFVYALKSKYRTERCDFCFAEGELQKCASCRYVYYCNRQCQKEAWSVAGGNHKIECGALHSITPRILPDAARIISRIIWKLNRGGDTEKGYYTDTKYRHFRDLMTHYDHLKTDTKRLEHFEALMVVLRQLFGGAKADTTMPSAVEVLKIYGRMLVNAFNILDAEMNSIGTGIYLGVSVTDHCCRSNAVATFEGTTLSVRLTEELAELDWSQVFISYVDLVNTAEHRQQELLQNYFFLCQCVKCLDPVERMEMNAAACPNVKCDGRIQMADELMTTRKCDRCETLASDELVAKFDEIMDVTKTHVENMKEIAYLDVCKVILAKQHGVLHRLNVWHVKTLDLAFESAIHFGKWTEALQYGTELLPGFARYHGRWHPLVGLLYMKIGKLLIHCGPHRDREALDHLKKAAEIIATTHGYQHSLFQGHLLPLLAQVEGC